MAQCCSRVAKGGPRCLRTRRAHSFFCYQHRASSLLHPDAAEGRAISRFQARVRGHLQRRCNALRGPCLLFLRSACCNDDELATCEAVARQDPFWWFSLRESSGASEPSSDDALIYWFDVRTLAKWTLSQVIPSNPYTRKPLPIEEMHRLILLLSMLKNLYGVVVPLFAEEPTLELRAMRQLYVMKNALTALNTAHAFDLGRVFDLSDPARLHLPLALATAWAGLPDATRLRWTGGNVRAAAGGRWLQYANTKFTPAVRADYNRFYVELGRMVWSMLTVFPSQPALADLVTTTIYAEGGY